MAKRSKKSRSSKSRKIRSRKAVKRPIKKARAVKRVLRKPGKVVRLKKLSRKAVRKAPKKAARRIAKKTRSLKIKRVTPSLRKFRQEVQTKISALETEAGREISGEPNLLVTFDPNKPASAKEEIQNLLRELNESVKIEDSGIGGVFKLTVSDSRKAVRKLSELCRNSPDKFNRTFHWVPIDRWCSSDVERMQQAIRELANNIDDNEKWKLSLERRNYPLHERELMIKLTEVIDKPNVDLKNPDKIIRVDILGERAGIAVLRSDELFNVMHFKKQ